MPGSGGDTGPLLEAYVRLRAKAADGFDAEARDSVLPGIKRLAEDAAGVFAATKIFEFGKQGLDELKDAQATAAQTASAITATGGAAGVSAEQVAELAGKLSDLSGHDDEAIQKGENLILTFKGIKNAAGEGNDIFNQATAAALDLSQSGFGSIESASVLLGKALDDPIAGVTALQRVGVKLNDSQKETIKSLVETGDVLGAQKIILGEVEHQVGGAAEAYGKTLPGELERARTSIDNAKAALVGGLGPAIEQGASLVTGLAQRFQEFPEPVQEGVGAVVLLGGSLGALARPVNDVIALLRTLRGAHEAAAVAAEGQALAESGSLIAGLGGLAPVAVPVIATLGLLGKSYLDARGDQAKAADTVRDYTAALLDQNGALQANIDSITAQKIIDAGITPLLSKASISARSFADEVRDGDQRLIDFANQVSQTSPELGTFRASLDEAKDSGDPFTQGLVAAYEQGKLTWPEVRKLADNARLLSLEFGEGEQKARAQAAALAVVKEITDQTTTSTNGLAGALAGIPGIGAIFGSAGRQVAGDDVPHRATGGPVYAGQVFRGAEFGDEEVVRAEEIVRLNSGPGFYRAPFDGYVRTAPETAARGGDSIVQHINIEIHSLREPAERAIRRELERHVALARR